MSPVSRAKQRAQTLIEALPYMRRFSGRTVVIKFGGHAMVDEALQHAFAQDLVLLQQVGIRPVVVHGGGPQIGRMLSALGIESRFVEGHRITDEVTMDVVQMVLVGQVNQGIVRLVNHHGGKAVGLSGKDGGLLMAEKMHIEVEKKKGVPPEIIDPGRVGKIKGVRPEVLDCLRRDGWIPVVAPVAMSESSETLNINADLVAGAIAGALGAEKLILLTDVEGLMDGDGAFVSRLETSMLEEMRNTGCISGGMLPKVAAVERALEEGVGSAHILDGRQPHAILLELFTDGGIGTMVLPNAK